MIPSFSGSGALPPFLGESAVDRWAASPYETTALAVAQRFGTTNERIVILRGWLSYRSALRRVGIVAGLQWIDGSFVEDVEATRGRPPGDMDIVTFAERPMEDIDESFTLMDQHPEIFDPETAKSTFHTDAYFIDLRKPPSLIVRDTAYFFGLFSHQRATALWKGMLHVALDSDDAKAIQHLDGG